MINQIRHPLKIFFNTRFVISRFQSQTTINLLNQKAPVELETNDELESIPIDSTIEWNKKLKFHRIRGEEKTAIKIFEIGVRKYQYQPDYITYVSMIEMCKESKDLGNGRYLHRLVEKSSVKENSRIQTLLMEMYIKCRDVDSARDMFDSLKNRTVIEYNAMMTAYNNNQYPDRALDLFDTMREKAKIKPNNISYMLYFQACIMLKQFDKGKAVHKELKEKVSAYIKNKELANQIISMYLASGDYPLAEEIFNEIKEPTVQNYVGLMNHYNESGKWNKSLELYERMKGQKKIQADIPTFLSVLSAAKALKNIEKAKEIQQDIEKQNLWQNHPDIQKQLKESIEVQT